METSVHNELVEAGGFQKVAQGVLVRRSHGRFAR